MVLNPCYSSYLDHTNYGHSCSTTFEQPIDMLIVKIELLNKTLLHYITPNNTQIHWDNQHRQLK